MTEEAKELKLKDVTSPVIAIVAMKSQIEAKEMMPGMHLPFYQVTIDPSRCWGTTNGWSPSRAFMRFGIAPGDELNGWQAAHDIEIFEVIAEYEEDEVIYPGLHSTYKKEGIDYTCPAVFSLRIKDCQCGAEEFMDE